jgi:hypothetical protein
LAAQPTNSMKKTARRNHTLKPHKERLQSLPSIRVQRREKRESIEFCVSGKIKDI